MNSVERKNKVIENINNGLDSDHENSLVIFERGTQLLAEANTIQKAHELKKFALTCADLARRVGMGKEAEMRARAYSLDAERRMGELLAETERAKGTDIAGKTKIDGTRSLPANPPPTLSDLGITKNESSRAQKLAELSEDTFQKVKTGVVPISSAINIIKNKHIKKVDVGPPDDAMNFVENAILSLEQIKPNDAHRKEAWAHLRRWLDEHE